MAAAFDQARHPAIDSPTRTQTQSRAGRRADGDARERETATALIGFAGFKVQAHGLRPADADARPGATLDPVHHDGELLDSFSRLWVLKSNDGHFLRRSATPPCPMPAKALKVNDDARRFQGRDRGDGRRRKYRRYGNHARAVIPQHAAVEHRRHGGSSGVRAQLRAGSRSAMAERSIWRAGACGY